MATPLFSNFARTTLAAGITNVAVVMNVSPGTGALFPSPGAGQYFPMVLVNSSGTKEVVYCTSRTVDALTITRAQEGTTNIAFNAGDVCGLRITASSLADLLTLVGSPTAVEATVASAATTNIGAAASMSVSISGVAAITAFDTVSSGTKRLCRATGAFTLTHSANLVCPGSISIIAASGDLFWAETTGAGVWYIGPYERANGQPLSLSVLQNSQSAAYTTVMADNGKHILHPSADVTARTFTIDSNVSVAYPIGATITFVNQNGAGVVTIAINTDTMRLAGAGTTGSRTLAANGIATALKVTSTEWIINGTGLT